MGGSESLSLVFGPIEEHGRVQVTDERLDEEEGEFGTILVATAIAPTEMTDACRGAFYSITSYETNTRNSGETNDGRQNRCRCGGFRRRVIPRAF
ncbi:MAG: hypothetical protein ACLFVS_00970 [Candidatus Acetothermia bacterium]